VVACPAAGACGGQFTANTMATALEFLGISPAGQNDIPALDRSREGASETAGRLAVDLVRKDVRPSRIITKAALENAAASIAATGGSTNGVLHLVAIAKELGLDFGIDDFDAISARTPIVADLKPFGRFVGGAAQPGDKPLVRGGERLPQVPDARQVPRQIRVHRPSGLKRRRASPRPGPRARTAAAYRPL